VRRRLKEAARLLLGACPLAGVDLVLIGREATCRRPFAALQDDLRRALAKLGVG
jgi:ribonuclease P protein component